MLTATSWRCVITPEGTHRLLLMHGSVCCATYVPEHIVWHGRERITPLFRLMETKRDNVEECYA
jgi:hypothetical protein